MKTVIKHEFDHSKRWQTIKMPVGSEILCVQRQWASTKLFVLADTDSYSNTNREFEVFITGDDIPDGNRKYISTIQMDSGKLEFHIFEKLP